MYRIALDQDGILSNFIEAVCHVHSVKNPYLDEQNHGKFSIEKILGLEYEEFWKKCDREFWANLPVMPGAVKLVNFLEREFGEESICVMTSPSKYNYGTCVDGKLDWLEKYFPQLLKRTKFGSFKEFSANEFSILIDDYHENAQNWENWGGRACLVPREWNTKYDIKHDKNDDWKYVANYLWERGIIN